MNKQQIERYALLINKIAAQRNILSCSFEPWSVPLSIVDQGRAVLRLVGFRPVWMAGGMAAFSVLRHHRAGKWMWRGLVGWRILMELRRCRQTSGQE